MDLDANALSHSWSSITRDKILVAPMALASHIKIAVKLGTYGTRMRSLEISVFRLMKAASHAAVHRNLKFF